jgi:hypothetical protein
MHILQYKGSIITDFTYGKYPYVFGVRNSIKFQRHLKKIDLEKYTIQRSTQVPLSKEWKLYFSSLCIPHSRIEKGVMDENVLIKFPRVPNPDENENASLKYINDFYIFHNLFDGIDRHGIILIKTIVENGNEIECPSIIFDPLY